MFWYVLGTAALALWFGGGVIAGFVAPQAAFGVLTDRVLAGTIAGAVLGRYAMISMISGLVYIVAWFFSRLTARPWRKRTLLVVALGLLVIAFSEWYVTPRIIALRSQFGPSGAPSDLRAPFDSLHRLSVIFFSVQWVLSGVAIALHGGTKKGSEHFV